MVKYDQANINKQINILSTLVNMNTEINNEFEAQKLLRDKLLEIKEEYNLDTYDISMFVKNGLNKKWKPGNSEPNVFVKIFFNEIDYAKDTYGLTNAECRFLYSISSFLLWEYNLLVDKEGLPLNQKRLIEKLDVSRATVSNTIRSLENKKCLIRIWCNNETYFLINPYLMWLGQNINKDLPKLFEMIGYEPMKYKNKKKD